MVRVTRATVSRGLAAIVASGILAQPAVANDFYAGKTISMSSHTTPGNSYDLYLRLLSRHYGTSPAIPS